MSRRAQIKPQSSQRTEMTRMPSTVDDVVLPAANPHHRQDLVIRAKLAVTYQGDSLSVEENKLKKNARTISDVLVAFQGGSV